MGVSVHQHRWMSKYTHIDFLGEGEGVGDFVASPGRRTRFGVRKRYDALKGRRGIGLSKALSGLWMGREARGRGKWQTCLR